MYKVVKLKDTVRIPPRRFEEDLETVITEELELMIAGRVEKNIGILLAVRKVEHVGEGRVILGDGGAYYDTLFEALAYEPQVNEVVEGFVSEVTEFGVFMNFGPMDGLIHVSQITEDFMSYDQKNAMFVGRESKKSLKHDEVIRARIVTVSLKSRTSDSKIGLTMRQPYLGKLEWLEEEREAGGKPKSEKSEKTDKKEKSGRKPEKPGKKEGG
ncbi:MAG TPA: DNA-directed RNA polymerase [Candidatus Altiarchaeales archaeon]|nr:DNA-directed RNA polymerase [Candidatus Altiarchaeales archaeon]